jgi:hypothetical protein
MDPLEARFGGLPGWELVGKGVADLAAGRSSIEAALALSASVRLRRAGIDLPSAAVPGEGSELYRLVMDDVGERRAHTRYNALRRRLLSFLRAASRATAG